jgi:hypothetical protein
MKLSKDQYVLLSRIFHERHDGWVPPAPGLREEPVTTFSTCVVVVEEFLTRAEPSIDDLPVEDIAQIEMWQEAIRAQPGYLRAVTIMLSDGKTEYTIKESK